MVVRVVELNSVQLSVFLQTSKDIVSEKSAAQSAMIIYWQWLTSFLEFEQKKKNKKAVL